MPMIVCACGCGWAGFVKGRGRYNPAGGCKRRMADRKRAKGARACACGAPICARAKQCASCQNRQAGKVRVYRKVHHRTCKRGGCRAPFETTNNRQEYCRSYCQRRAYQENYHGFTAADWQELVAEGVADEAFAEPKRVKTKRPPKQKREPGPRVSCPFCAGTCTRNRTRYLVLIQKAVDQWRCRSCGRHHQRYPDGAIHQPIDQKWVAARTKIQIGPRGA